MHIKLEYSDRAFASPTSNPSELAVRYKFWTPCAKAWPTIEDKIRKLLLNQQCCANVYLWDDEKRANGELKKDYRFGLVFRKGKVFRAHDLQYIGPNFLYDYDWSSTAWNKQLSTLREELEREEVIDHVDSLHQQLKSETAQINIECSWSRSQNAHEAKITLSLKEATFLAEALKLAIRGKLALQGVKHKTTNSDVSKK